jgi:D-sedoheptulose 7-phosphate isomerase
MTVNDLVHEHFVNYRYELQDALNTIDTKEIAKAINYLFDAYHFNRTVFVCGNGGSAAIADHFVCDNSKLVHYNTNIKIKIYSLNSNVPMLTAYANDEGYESVYSNQLEILGDSGDVLFVISSSGNSPNIISAIKKAQQKGMAVITLTGFDGGQAKQLGDVNIHVSHGHYGKVEDCHHIVMHTIASYISKREAVDLNKLRI